MKHTTLQNTREGSVRVLGCWTFMLLLALCVSQESYAQVRAGSAYLKLQPGTRQQSLGNGVTGGLDLTYSLYANPAAAGFLREWQYSASATRWIADISNVSLLYGTQLRLRTPWSRRLNLAFGANYQSVGEFDATRGAEAAVSANDLLLSSSIGLPLDNLSRNFAFGANVKYLRSELAQFSASTFVFDVGALWRSRRFRLSDEGHFGIISAGISVNQLGKPLTFIAEETPLPRMYRGGVALNFGMHDGLQFQLAADYRDIRDEVNQVSLGVEVINVLSFLPDALTLDGKLSRILAFRGSYVHNSGQASELLGKWSWGFSFRFDDYMNGNRISGPNSFFPAFPPQNSEFRFDGGTIGSERFASVYQGSGTLRPLRPEYFEFVRSEFHSYDLSRQPQESYRYCDTIDLQWQASVDPDLYDDVNYILLLAQNDSASVLRSIEQAERQGLPAHLLHDSAEKELPQVRLLMPSATQDTLNGIDVLLSQPQIDLTKHVVHQNGTIQFKLGPEHTPPDSSLHAAGDYFWAVLAYDRNGHVRTAQLDGHRIGRFRVETDPYITMQINNRRWQADQYVADLIVSNRDSVAIEEGFSVDFFAYDSRNYARSVAFKPVRVDSATLAMSSPEVETRAPQVVDFERSVFGMPVLHHTIPQIQPGQSDTLTVPLNSERPYMLAVTDLGRQLLCEPTAVLDTLSMYDLEIEKSVSVKPVSINIEFEFNRPYPRQGEEKRFGNIPLAALQQALNSPLLPKSYIEIVGHTDDRGTAAYNQRLSLSRADWVKDFLVRNFAFDSTRICALGHGEDHPLSSKHVDVEKRYRAGQIDLEEREKLHKANRRVEIRLRREEVACAETNEIIRAVSPGDTVTFSLKLTNHGPLPARDFRIVDNLSPFLQPLAGNPTEWHFDEFGDGRDTTLTYKTQVQAGFPTSTYKIINTARIIAPNDTSSANDQSTSEVIAIDLPIPTRNYDLQLTSTVRPDSIASSETVQYSTTISNLGPAPAYAFGIESAFSKSFAVQDVSFSQPPDSTASNSYFWKELQSRGNSRITIDYTMQANQKLSGILEAKSRIVHALDDTITSNNVVTDTVFVKGQNRTYTVRPGDTLSKIALKFYGNVSFWREIFKTNRGLIADPNVLEIGWQLVIPVIEPSRTTDASLSSSMNRGRDGESATVSDNGELDLRALLRDGVSVR